MDQKQAQLYYGKVQVYTEFLRGKERRVLHNGANVEGKDRWLLGMGLQRPSEVPAMLFYDLCRIREEFAISISFCKVCGFHNENFFVFCLFKKVYVKFEVPNKCRIRACYPISILSPSSSPD